MRASGIPVAPVWGMFFFFNRLGCLGSLAVSVVGTLLLLALSRGCSTGPAPW